MNSSSYKPSQTLKWGCVLHTSPKFCVQNFRRPIHSRTLFRGATHFIYKTKSLAKARLQYRKSKCSQKTEQEETKLKKSAAWVLFLQNNSSSPRSISIVQLNTLPCLHLRPIKLVVYKWPYFLKGMGYLILRCVSRLAAFSVYHDRTRLPGYALGRTTDAPEVRPTRSSRTKVSSSQISYAHDR